MAKNAPSTTRIYQFIFGLAFLFICYGAVRGMMFGALTNAKQIGFLSLAVGVVLWLDRRYWLVLPLCQILNLNIPGLPFDSVELGCIAITGMHFIRTSLHRDPYVPWNRRIIVAFPLFFWICGIWAVNPVGMNILGSSTMGGRFYIKILLGFFAMISLSCIRLGELECKLLFRVLMAGALLSITLTLIRPSLFSTSDVDPSQVGTRYYLLAFSGLYHLIWARFSIPKVFSSLRLLAITGLSALAIAASGKRSSTAGIALFPIYRAILTRQHLGLTAVMGVVAFLLLSMVVAMDGHYIQLPESPKRALSLVFPKYRQRGREGFHDPFRAMMAERAREVIRENPWVGRKGFRMDSQEMYWVVGMRRGKQYEGHTLAGAWHSAFWAFAADFGIPCLLFYLFFLWNGLKVSFHYSRKIPTDSFQSACCLYYSFLIIHDAVLIYTSGGSSSSSLKLMLQFGMLLAIANGFDYEEAHRVNLLASDNYGH